MSLLGRVPPFGVFGNLGFLAAPKGGLDIPKSLGSGALLSYFHLRRPLPH